MTLRRLAMPLAALTGVGMLASDLYLPALPSMQSELAVSMTAGQGTMAIFMLSLAVSQLIWGWLADRYGDLSCIVAGTGLLALGSVLCGLAPDIGTLLAGRLLQGLGAGAATVAVPALIRRRFSETDSVGAMAVVATVESTIPALGPILGAAIVLYWDWRWSFYLIAALALALLPVVSRIVKGAPPPVRDTRVAPASTVLSSWAFVRHALSYAAMFAALLMFVASAPHLVTLWLATDISKFALLQLCGVAAFMVGATAGTRLVYAYSIEKTMLTGCALQILAAALMLGYGLADTPSLAGLVGAWAAFCAGLGLRGPSLMSRTMSLALENPGKAAGLLMATSFGATALATMLVAPYLDGGLFPVAVGVAGLVLVSVALVPFGLGPSARSN